MSRLRLAIEPSSQREPAVSMHGCVIVVMMIKPRDAYMYPDRGYRFRTHHDPPVPCKRDLL